jgi:hypothetical protein
MKLRRKWLALVIPLVVGAACSLNPQPLPPGETPPDSGSPSSSTGGGSGTGSTSSGGNGSGSSSGSMGAADATVPGDAGFETDTGTTALADGGNVDAGSPEGGMSDAASDAPADAPPEGASSNDGATE